MSGATLLHGDLADRPLAAVLGEALRRGLEGRLTVEGASGPLLDLRIAAGEASADADPAASVARAAAAPGGRFSLLAGGGSRLARAIPLGELVLAAARAIPDDRRVAALLGDLDRPLALTERSGGGTEAGLRVGRQAGFLLSRIDGTLSARQVCELVPEDEGATLRELYGLVAAGLVRLSPRRGSPSGGGSLAALEGFLRRTGAATSAPAGGKRPTGPLAGGGARSGTAPPARPAPPAAATSRPPSTGGPGRRSAATHAPRVPTGAPPAAPTASAERQALEERLRLATNQNLYQLMGVAETAGHDEIRRTYYALARKFHPDRFHRAEVRDLQPALEQLFGRMTEAYQTLSDPQARRDYDEGRRRRPADARATQEAAAHEVARENHRRGRALCREGQVVKALPFLENAVKAQAGRAEYLETLGAVQSLNPRFKLDAETNLRRAIELEPTRTSAFVFLGLHCARYQRRAEAEAALRQALAWDPGCDSATVFLGKMEGDDAQVAREATDFLRKMLTTL